mgnify:CR=1 FL=1
MCHPSIGGINCEPDRQMTSIAILRSCSLFASGVVGYEIYRRCGSPLPMFTPSPILTPPTVIVNHSNEQYTKYIPLGILGVGLLYMIGGRNYVSSQQFKKAYVALQTQVTDLSATLVNVKQQVFEKFGIVEKRLDDVERIILTKTAEIKRDVANVETMLVAMSTKVDKIDNQTEKSATDIRFLCDAVAGNLGNTLQNKEKIIQELKSLT